MLDFKRLEYICLIIEYLDVAGDYGGLNTPTLSTREHLMEITPLPFRQRHIFCGNRLYQNKYEMSAWGQEARARGLTNPGEAFRYARQKEISIHGG